METAPRGHSATTPSPPWRSGRSGRRPLPARRGSARRGVPALVWRNGGRAANRYVELGRLRRRGGRQVRSGTDPHHGHVRPPRRNEGSSRAVVPRTCARGPGPSGDRDGRARHRPYAPAGDAPSTGSSSGGTLPPGAYPNGGTLAAPLQLDDALVALGHHLVSLGERILQPDRHRLHASHDLPQICSVSPLEPGIDGSDHSAPPTKTVPYQPTQVVAPLSDEILVGSVARREDFPSPGGREPIWLIPTEPPGEAPSAS